ncbi:MAG: trypsin-like peptidase domain-containing protein [Phycisphaerae bacterium]|nr:trypsin-like peptidase domain-containing protein [Phycisphaerae bacterium]
MCDLVNREFVIPSCCSQDRPPAAGRRRPAVLFAGLLACIVATVSAPTAEAMGHPSVSAIQQRPGVVMAAWAEARGSSSEDDVLGVAGAVQAEARGPFNGPPPAGNGTELLERLQQAFESVIGRVSPSVVAIHGERSPTKSDDDTAAAPLDPSSTGGGVIIREDGMILTSQHVIEAAGDIHVTLHDGRRLRANLVAADERSDLAILHTGTAGLTAAQLGDASEVRRGHLVLAFGNPLGLANDGQAAVSQGIVSAVGRPLPTAFGRDQDRYYGDMIQITAQVSPGNSGGPLVDIHGRVIGVVTALGVPSDGNEGIGFAVPITAHTKEIISKLLRGERIDYGYLGVQVTTPTDAQRRAAGLGEHRGALVDFVLAGGPADRADLRSGDIIVALGQTDILSADHFIRLIGAAGPGQRIEITFVRDSKQHRVTVQLARREAPTTQPLPLRTINFRGAVLGEVEPAMRSASNLPDNALLVLMVNAGSPADRAGLTPGDIIVRVQGQSSTSDVEALLGSSSGDVLLGLANGGSALVKAE